MTKLTYKQLSEATNTIRAVCLVLQTNSKLEGSHLTVPMPGFKDMMYIPVPSRPLTDSERYTYVALHVGAFMLQYGV